MPVTPDLTGFFAANAFLRTQMGSPCVFHLPIPPTWPSGTKLNPTTGRPYDATIVRLNAPQSDVTKTVLIILKQGSPLRPQADTHWEEAGLLSGMDIIIDIAESDYADVQTANEFTIATLRYKVEEGKPFELAGTLYRRLIYGMER